MRKLALFSGGFAAAAAIFVYLLRDVRALWFAGACLVFSPLLLRLGARRCCAVFLGLSAGLLWCSAYGQLWLAPADRLCGTAQTVTVELTDNPAVTTYGCRAMGRLQVENRTYLAVLYGDKTLQTASAGDLVSANVQIEPAGLAVADGESLYLRSQGAVLRLSAKDGCTVTPGKGSWPVRLRHRFTRSIPVRPPVSSGRCSPVTGQSCPMAYRMSCLWQG